MTSFPTSLDSLNNPASGDNLNTAGVVHHTQHDDANDAIEALEAKVGVNSSAVTTSLDYKIANITSNLTYAAPSLTLGTTNSAGAANSLIRSDATVAAFDATAPTTSAVGDAAAIGSTAKAARRDHVHGRESFATPSVVLGTAAAAGAATTPITSDSTIAAFDVTTPVVQAFGDSAATGSAAFAARRDHKHGMPAAQTMQITFTQTGTLAVAAGTIRWYPPAACTITTVRASVNTVPTGASIKCDVNKNGTTIFTTQANRPTIAISGNTALSGTPDITALTTTDYVQVDIDQIGSTIAGSDLSVTIGYSVP